MMTTSESANPSDGVGLCLRAVERKRDRGGLALVLELSREFELWVITRANNREPIERWMAANHGYESIHWIYFDLSASELARKHGRKGVHRYYLKWTKASDAVISETMWSNGIETSCTCLRKCIVACKSIRGIPTVYLGSCGRIGDHTA